ncbi:MAG: ATP-binding protein [Clostridiales Family XIII bacterium]|jgi:AAA+ ATPase superfamily predicted ATPase|nr:ATP-binding protein [Clostridiales Family XIII bacterium]
MQISEYFNLGSDNLNFDNWETAFKFIGKQSGDEKVLVIIDEYPYIAENNKSLNSMLQVAIDQILKDSKIKLILSGSHVAFMEKKVMGTKSPLYGRRTGMIQLRTFNYFDAAKMLDTYSNEDKIKFYSILGIAKGMHKSSQISDYSGVDKTSCSAYLKTLVDIGFIKRVVSIDQNPLTSRKGEYYLADKMMMFWYEYIYSNLDAIEFGAGNMVGKQRIFPYIEDYIGKNTFEEIALQYLIRKNNSGELPFLATKFGKWWGNDKIEKKQSDIDVVVEDFEYEKKVILGECKWRNSFKELFDSRIIIGIY